jgi:hypothetical protein
MPERQPPAPPNRMATALMALLLVIGFYFPTSEAETISIRLYLVSAAILASILGALLLRRRGVLSLYAVVNVAAINVILLVCTLFSPFTDFAYGGYIPILVLSVLFCVNVKDIGLTTVARRLFDIANAINIVLAALLMLEVPGVTQFFLDHYAYGYQELLPTMLEGGKPVITFGSHSLAAFFFYLLFYLTLHTFIVARSKLNLVFALCYLAMLFSLSSFTALVFGAVATVQLALCFQWRKSVLAGLVTGALVLLAAVVVVPRLDSFSDFKEDVTAVFERQDNGLMGRYSDSGGVAANLDYITSHPFSPIGLGMSSQLWYADSGPVEYLMKGSFPLLITVYIGAFFFIRKNLRSRRRALFLFLVFLGFEVGYSNLQYIRTQCFLPFALVYLNWLDTAGERKPASGQSVARWQYA